MGEANSLLDGGDGNLSPLTTHHSPLKKVSPDDDWRMYVCRGDSCYAFEVSHIGEVIFCPDSFRVERYWQYAYEQMDSVVFRQPDLTMAEMGWWGDTQNGSCRYQNLTFWEVGVTFQVSYQLTSVAGICQSALCELRFPDEETARKFWSTVILNQEATTSEDPYIYVKNTQTGPRKFEVWEMGGSVTPAGLTWEQTGCMLYADCTALLTGRPMSEVMEIVEAWVQQPVEKQLKPTDDEP